MQESNGVSIFINIYTQPYSLFPFSNQLHFLRGWMTLSLATLSSQWPSQVLKATLSATRSTERPTTTSTSSQTPASQSMPTIQPCRWTPGGTEWARSEWEPRLVAQRGVWRWRWIWSPVLLVWEAERWMGRWRLVRWGWVKSGWTSGGWLYPTASDRDWSCGSPVWLTDSTLMWTETPLSDLHPTASLVSLTSQLLDILEIFLQQQSIFFLLATSPQPAAWDTQCLSPLFFSSIISPHPFFPFSSLPLSGCRSVLEHPHISGWPGCWWLSRHWALWSNSPQLPSFPCLLLPAGLGSLWGWLLLRGQRPGWPREDPWSNQLRDWGVLLSVHCGWTVWYTVCLWAVWWECLLKETLFICTCI